MMREAEGGATCAGRGALGEEEVRSVLPTGLRGSRAPLTPRAWTQASSAEPTSCQCCCALSPRELTPSLPTSLLVEPVLRPYLRGLGMVALGASWPGCGSCGRSSSKT